MKKLLILSLFLFGCGKEVSITGTASQVLGYTISQPTNGGTVTEQFMTSHDRNHIVFISSEATPSVNDLFVTDSTGANKVNLSHLALNKNVTKFAIAPNDSKIAFLADINTTGRQDLYTVNLDGSALTRVNLGLSSSAQMVQPNFQFTNDSSRVIFATDEVSTGTLNIYSVNSNGTNRFQLNAVSPASPTFQVALDDSRLVYRTAVSANTELHSVTLQASNDITLNSPFDVNNHPAAGVDSGFKISPDSTRVIYISNQDGDGTAFDLYVTSLTASTPVKVNSQLPSLNGTSGRVNLYSFSPNGTKIVYTADQYVVGLVSIFSANSDATSMTQLNSETTSDQNVPSFKITDDSSTVIYISDQRTMGLNEIFSAQINGGTNYRLNSFTANNIAPQYQIIGSRVVYLMDKAGTGVYSAYSNNFVSSKEIMISPTPTAGGFYNTTSEQLLVLNDRAILVGSLDGGTTQAFSVAADGTSFTQITSSGVSLSTVQTYSFALTSGYLVYRSENGLFTTLVRR